jgi:hypothetical protein
MIACFKLQNPTLNKYIVQHTEFAEILVHKTSYYFFQLPPEVPLPEMREICLNKTLGKYEKATLLSMLKCLEFMDKCVLHSSDNEFKNVVQKAFFNFFLIEHFNEPLRDAKNVIRLRTHLQYLTEIINVCVSKPMIEVISSFLFGFTADTEDMDQNEQDHDVELVSP